MVFGSSNAGIGDCSFIPGKIGKNKKRTATSTGEIYSPDGEILAQAEALLIEVPDEMLDTVDIESLGWKVYDENVDIVG